MASKIKSGSESDAAMLACAQPITQFYQYWRALSNSAVPAYVKLKRKIRQYRSKNNRVLRDSLESQLLALFYGAGLSLSVGENKRVKSDDVFGCVHQIANTLDSILRSHRCLHEIPLPGKEAEFECETGPTESELAVLSSNFRKALVERAPLLGDDSFVIQAHLFFEIVSRNFLDPCFFHARLNELTQSISSLDHLVIALQLLPPEKWDQLLLALSKINKIETVLAPNDVSWDAIAFILKKLPPRDWRCFCDALSRLDFIDEIIYPVDLLRLADSTPENQHDIFREAIYTLSLRVIPTASKAGMLFKIGLPYLWDVYYYLFQRAIDPVCIDEFTIADFFLQVADEDWSYLAIICRSILESPVSSVPFWKAILPLFGEGERLIFIEAVLPLLDTRGISPSLLLAMYIALNTGDRKTFIRLLGEKRISKAIQNVAELRVILLTMRNHNCYVAFLTALSHTGCLHFKIEADALYRIAQTLPLVRDDVFFKLFADQLPRILREFSVTFSMSLSYHNTLSPEFLTQFNYFLDRALPFLFSNHWIGGIAPLIFDEKIIGGYLADSPIVIVRAGFNRIGNEIQEGKINDRVGCFEKIKLLKQFIETRIEMTSVFAGNFYRVHRALLEFFGKDFFDEMLKYKSKEYDALYQAHFSSRNRGTQTVAFFPQARRLTSSTPPQNLSAASQMRRR